MKIANAVLLMAAVGSANAQVSFDLLCLLLSAGGLVGVVGPSPTPWRVNAWPRLAGGGTGGV